MADSVAPLIANPFAPSQHERRKAWRADLAKWILCAMAITLVVPVLIILADIFIKAAPVLSFDFITENPSDKGKAGGIWAPLIGTFYLVVISLLIVAPIGVTPHPSRNVDRGRADQASCLDHTVGADTK